MTIDRDTAAAALRDIAATEQRTFEALFSAGSSNFLFMWGGLTAAGYIFEFFVPRHAQWGWWVVWALGFLAMPRLIVQRSPVDRRLQWAGLALVGFGLLVAVVLGPFSFRQLDAFWPLLFMFGYVLAGIWVGRFFIRCGVFVAVLTIAGYLWSGPWFPLWMAVANGGALIAGGWWLRRTGARV